MKYSIVKNSKIDLGDRIDAEYFEPSYLENENRLKKVDAKPLSCFSKLTSSAFYPSATEYYATGEMPFIRCVDCIDFYAITSLQAETFEKLPHIFIKENKTIKKLNDGDIVITKVGSPCFASVIYGLGEVALSRTVLGVYEIKGIDPLYLTVFLRSKYGFEQLVRERELTIQYQLTLNRVGRILIFKPTNESFEKIIRELFIKSQQLHTSAVGMYRQAEQILLSELNLLMWKPKHSLSFIKNYSDIQTTLRIDAEYFQPKYEDIVKEIKKYKEGYGLLGELVSIKDKNVVPEDESAYKYIELANISTNGNITGFTESLGHELPTRARRKVRTGDILVSSIEGSLSSIALINAPLNNALCSTGFYVIDSEAINSETLLVLLKSKVGQLQLKKGCSGTILTAISKGELKKVIVPKISGKIQDIVKTKITEMYKAKFVSDELFNIAKRGVELAIEKDEPQAQKWINEELKRIGITISK